MRRPPEPMQRVGSVKWTKQAVGLQSPEIAVLAVGLETEAVRWLNEAQHHMYSILLSVVSELPRLPTRKSRDNRRCKRAQF